MINAGRIDNQCNQSRIGRVFRLRVKWLGRVEVAIINSIGQQRRAISIGRIAVKLMVIPPAA